MQFNIPDTNDRLLLTKNWSFTLWNIYNNSDLFHAENKDHLKERTQLSKEIPFTLKKGMILNVKKLVLAKVAADQEQYGTNVSYISFIIEIPEKLKKKYGKYHGKKLYVKMKEANFKYKQLEKRVIEKRKPANVGIKLYINYLPSFQNSGRVKLSKLDAYDLDNLRNVEFRMSKDCILINDFPKNVSLNILNALKNLGNHCEAYSVESRTPEWKKYFDIYLLGSITDVEIDKMTALDEVMTYVFKLKTTYLLKDLSGAEVGRYKDGYEIIQAAKKHLKKCNLL